MTQPFNWSDKSLWPSGNRSCCPQDIFIWIRLSLQNQISNILIKILLCYLEVYFCDFPEMLQKISESHAIFVIPVTYQFPHERIIAKRTRNRPRRLANINLGRDCQVYQLGRIRHSALTCRSALGNNLISPNALTEY